MTSLFDQYEQDSQRSIMSNSTNQGNSAFEEVEKPMFQKQKIKFKPRHNERITHIAASNDTIVMAMSNNVLVRIDLKRALEPQEIELNRIVPGVGLTGLFLDPSANHLLISFQTELLYQNRRFPKPKPTSKLRGFEITAVGWHPVTAGMMHSESSTKPMLLGTSKGIIYEMEISADESIFSSSLDLYCKQLFDIGKRDCRAITGLQYHQWCNSDVYFVIVTTINRLYQFVGRNSGPDERPLLAQLFNKYLNTPEGFQEIHSSLNYSCLQLYSSTFDVAPSDLGWLTETGLFYAKIDLNNESDILTKRRMLNCPDLLVQGEQQQQPQTSSTQQQQPDKRMTKNPLAFVFSDFHILLLYADRVVGMCTLNEEVAFLDNYNTELNGKLVRIAKDPIKGTVWVAAEKGLFRYKICDEDRNMWKIYAAKGNYELAKKFCKDPASLDQVLVMEAENYFNNNQFEDSALVYAATQSSFEEIALKFLMASQNKALKMFLMGKLSKLRDTDKAQVTMLVLWILELILSEMGELRTRGKQNTSGYKVLQDELDSFLRKDSKLIKCIDRNKLAIYELMASHGDNENLLKLAKSQRAYEKVINHHIYKGEYIQALNVLKSHGSKEMWYMYAPTLVQGIPKETLSTIVELESLNPSRLLPALVAADTNQYAELIRYLEYCINDLNCQEQAVHNFLLSLYAQYRPDRLMTYLAMQGEEASMVNYDIGYAVRVCRQYGHSVACVRLLALLGLWQSAVDLALTVSVQVAKQTASLPQCPAHLSTKLWLKIAQHVVQEKNDIVEAMNFLQQCDSIKIEDILPFFNDFVTIDHFKGAICSSLQEYNQHIQDLKEEMEDATKSAENIRNEIHSFRSRFTIVETENCCVSCGLQLLLRPFYIFPCGHMFHTDCLVLELSPLLTDEVAAQVKQLQWQLQSANGSSAVKEKLKVELDDILATQCLYCGDHMINLINKPFIEEDDYERIKKEWE